MENNIFFKLKNREININQNINTKYNPDIYNKYNDKETERTTNSYNLSTVIYNPITGIIPQKIMSQDDLKLNCNNNLSDINKLISDKEKERTMQEQLFNNNVSTDSMIIDDVNEINVESNNRLHPNNSNIINNNQQRVINNYNQNSYVDNFNELKSKSLNNNNNNNNNDNFNSILSGLKDLGILN